MSVSSVTPGTRKECIIIGGGICGLVTALVLAKLEIKCTIYELYDKLPTTGGAVDLSPSSLNLLKELEVEVLGCEYDSVEIFSYHSGRLIGELTADGDQGSGMKVLRVDLMKGLLAAIERTDVEIIWGSNLVKVEEIGDLVIAQFSDGNITKGDFLLGCDGMHSAVRTAYVEPGRKPIYSKATATYAVVDGTNLHSETHFKDSCQNSGMYGSLQTTFVEPDRKRIYLASTLDAPEDLCKEGWSATGEDTDATASEITRRFGKTPFHCVPELIQRIEEYSYYPVYQLEDGGIWCQGRVLLLGDAAHGMPPQGENSRLAIEDAVLLGRVIQRFPDKPITEVFSSYEMTRKPRIALAYKDAIQKWGTMNDKTWVAAQIEEWVVWIVLWWKAEMKRRLQKEYVYDVHKEPILE